MSQSAEPFDPVPDTEQLFKPVLDAITKLGGSAIVSEIESHVIEELGLGTDVLEIRHENSGQVELKRRLNLARNRLKNYGYLNNTSRGVWALTADKGARTIDLDIFDDDEPLDEPRRRRRSSVRAEESTQQDDLEDSSYDEDFRWREELRRILVTMDPGDFERLCQRILRESNFTEVNVTGKTGDGGIDGKGIIRIGGLISFPILFQCKRWKGSVGSSVVRDFRGAMQGRADRGLIMTTGTFSTEASKEATRDGAPTIDLVDGDALIDRLRELQLGVTIEMVERVDVDTDWWESNYGVSV